MYTRNLNSSIRRSAVPLAIVALELISTGAQARDAAADKKRAQLAGVRRIIVVPPGEVAEGLKAESLTPRSLFFNNGTIRNGKFALPDPESVHALAARLHGDAVLLGALDEPRLTKGHFYVDFGGVNYETAHV